MGEGGEWGGGQEVVLGPKREQRPAARTILLFSFYPNPSMRDLCFNKERLAVAHGGGEASIECFDVQQPYLYRFLEEREELSFHWPNR